MRPGPAWLAQLQARFGAVLRTPLDRSTGTLRAQPDAYEVALCQKVQEGPGLGSEQRLSVYNRQYWFRLFGVMQNEYPLTAALFGYWRFNDYAARFLLENPPCNVDIHKVAEGFDEFLLRAVPEPSIPLDPSQPALPRAALQDAARLDTALRHALYAPKEPRLRLAETDAQGFARGRLRPRTGLTVLSERWPLVALRRQLGACRTGGRASLPPPHSGNAWWAVFGTDAGTGQLELSLLQAQLFLLLIEHPVAEALARLEAGCPLEERAALPARVQGWLAQSAELGFWSALTSE
jgi:hypothetical protein